MGKGVRDIVFFMDDIVLVIRDVAFIVRNIVFFLNDIVFVVRNVVFFVCDIVFFVNDIENFVRNMVRDGDNSRNLMGMKTLGETGYF